MNTQMPEANKEVLEEITLRNGAVIIKPVLLVTQIALEDLFQKLPIIAYEIVMLARNPNHKIFARENTIAKSNGLIENNGTIKDSIRECILAMTSGDDLDMHMIDPINGPKTTIAEQMIKAVVQEQVENTLSLPQGFLPSKPNTRKILEIESPRELIDKGFLPYSTIPDEFKDTRHCFFKSSNEGISDFIQRVQDVCNEQNTAIIGVYANHWLLFSPKK